MAGAEDNAECFTDDEIRMLCRVQNRLMIVLPSVEKSVIHDVVRRAFVDGVSDDRLFYEALVIYSKPKSNAG